MVIILTNSEDATADYLCTRLTAASFLYYRFNSDTILKNCQLGYASSGTAFIVDNGTRYDAAAFSHVWLRRPKSIQMNNVPDAAENKHIAQEWSEALEGFFAHIPIKNWINHYSCNVNASHKIEQLTRAQAMGISIPRTLLTQETAELEAFWQQCDGHIIVKPLASGYLERDCPAEDTLIYTNQVYEAHIRNPSLRNCPTLFQEQIFKKMDVRICIIDDYVKSVGIKATENSGHQRLDIRRNNMNDVQYVTINLPEDIRAKLLRLVRSYGLRFAAIDMALDQNDDWIFFEINPNGQWAWLDLVAGCDIASGFLAAFHE